MKLPDELDASLRHEAARRGLTVSQLTCEGIEQWRRTPRVSVS